jgi:hypothetical protein
MQQANVMEARLSGRHDGEAFALALRQRELRERQERLTLLAWGSDGEAAFSAAEPISSEAEVLRLQHDMEQLASFHQAVLRSRPWRVIQLLRHLLGRAW